MIFNTKFCISFSDFEIFSNSKFFIPLKKNFSNTKFHNNVIPVLEMLSNNKFWARFFRLGRKFSATPNFVYYVLSDLKNFLQCQILYLYIFFDFKNFYSAKYFMSFSTWNIFSKLHPFSDLELLCTKFSGYSWSPNCENNLSQFLAILRLLIPLEWAHWDVQTYSI